MSTKEKQTVLPIKSPHPEDLAYFNDLKKQLSATARDAFHALVTQHRNAGAGVSGGGDQAAEIEELKDEVENLNKHLTTCREDKGRIIQHCEETKAHNEELETQIAALRAELETRNQERETNAVPELVEGPRLTGLQFIVDPPKDLGKAIERCVAYDIKKQRLQRGKPDDMLNQFTLRAIRYTIKNEYSHILK